MRRHPPAAAVAAPTVLISAFAALIIPSGAGAAPSSPPPPSAIEIPIAYHAQQDGDWCDPADIEMWLLADGVAVPAGGDHSAQQRFWDYETSHNDGYTVAQWNASPYAVAVTLDRFGSRDDIGDAPQASLAAAGSVISRSVAELHQPVIVMVGGATHYVLVTGVVLGRGGATAPPVMVTYVDPLAYGVGGSPAPGSNGTATTSWAGFGDWYTPDTHHGGVWAGRWVLVAAGVPLVA